MLGERVTYLDFMAHDLLDWYRLYKEDSLGPHENLRQYMTRMESLDGFGEYYRSDKYYTFPIFAPFARWGNQGWRHEYNANQ